MPLGIPAAHAVQTRREERGLFRALAAADLDDDVLLVDRIAWPEQRPQLRGERVDLRRRGRELLAREIAEISIVALHELLRLPELRFGGAQRADRVHDRGE